MTLNNVGKNTFSISQTNLKMGVEVSKVENKINNAVKENANKEKFISQTDFITLSKDFKSNKLQEFLKANNIQVLGDVKMLKSSGITDFNEISLKLKESRTTGFIFGKLDESFKSKTKPKVFDFSNQASSTRLNAFSLPEGSKMVQNVLKNQASNISAQIKLAKNFDESNLFNAFVTLPTVDETGLSDGEKELLGQLKESFSKISEFLDYKSGTADLPATMPKESDVKNFLIKLSQVSNHPKLIDKLIENSTFNHGIYNKEGSIPLDKTQLQTSFIKWSKKEVANMYFETTIDKKILQSVADKIFPNKSDQTSEKMDQLKSTFANMGFNRLMSGNNNLGASLSSDIDFKLVIDDEKLGKLLTQWGKSDTEKGKILKDVPDVAFRALNSEKDDFVESFKLTLEVQKFSVKTISKVREDLDKDVREQNFVSTVLHNSSYMSGDPEVHEKFLDLVKEKIPPENILKNNWTQYLGDSDKGSIKIIKNLKSIENVSQACINAVADTPSNFNKAKEFLKSDPEIVKHVKEFFKNDKLNISTLTREQMKTLLTNDTGIQKKVVADLASDLKNNLNVKKSFGEDFPILQDVTKMEDKISTIVKLLDSFTKDGKTNFIGRDDLTDTKDWMFSVKYSGCRLNDVFDSSPLETFTSKLEDKKTTLKNKLEANPTDPNKGEIQDDIVRIDSEIASTKIKYRNSKLVAESINSFAVQIQDRTYEKYQGKEKPEGGTYTHDDIDTMYDRITANEFVQMLKDPDMKQKIIIMVDNMVSDLNRLGKTSDLGVKVFEDIDKISDVAMNLRRVDLDDDALLEQGFLLFNSMSKIVETTAEHIKP